MADPKQFLTRSGSFRSLDQIVETAKTEGVQIAADGDWVVQISVRRRGKPAPGGDITPLSEDELDAIFGLRTELD